MKHKAFNPYLPPWEYIPDGEPHLFDGRVYVYGSHDAAGGAEYCLGDYVCWSAPADDLGAWSFEGVIYRKDDDPDNPDGSLLMFAPDVCRGADGRYYLYYGQSDCAGVRVAVCDSPAGHFRFLGAVCLPDGEILSPLSGYGQPFDPAVYTEDGKAWLYYGFGVDYGFGVKGVMGSYVAALASDMVTLAEEPRLIAPGPAAAAGTPWEGHPFFEASSMRKIGGRYYFIYSSLQGHELCYGLAEAPDAVPAFQGVLISGGDVGLPGHETEEKAAGYLGNNHGSLIDVEGQTYVFWHRHTHGTQHSRQGCAECVKIREDGTIPQAEVTSCGLNGGPLPAEGDYPAYIACALHGAAGVKHFSSHVVSGPEDAFITEERSVCGSDADCYITNLRPGAGCGFKYFAFEGAKNLALEVRGTLKGSIRVHLDDERAEPVLQIPVEPSGKFHLAEGSLPVADGTHALFFTFEGEGACDLRSFTFLKP